MKNWIIPLIATSLGLMGLATLSSVSPELMQRQLVFFFVSAMVFWAAAKMPFAVWKQWGEWLWKALILVLIGLLIFGRVTRGAVAWIDLGFGLRFQPSQFAILAVVFAALPHFLKTRMLSDTQLLHLLILIGLPAGLILLQPDFGTTFLYLISLLPLIFFQKIPAQYWRIGALALAAIAFIGWNFVLQPYQKLRITSFFSGSQTDQSSAGYNARQALIAVGSGQIWGKGLGHGTQSQLRFLPERQTDFIFASLAEEWGLAGSCIILALYAWLISFLLIYAAKATQPDQTLFLLTTAVFFLAQTTVNIGMNIGLLPITGITLPLVSYGGSSLLATLFMLGIAQHLIVQIRHRPHSRIS